MDAEIKTSAFTRALVELIARRPVAVLLLGLALSLAFVPGLLRVQTDFTHRAFFWDDDPYLKQFEAFERKFGNDDAVVVALHSPSGIFDMESATVLQHLTEELWKLPEVIRVDSLSKFNWVHSSGDDIVIEPLLPDELTPEILAARKQVALTHETIPGYLVSKDAQTALMFARIKPAIDAPSDYRAIITAARRIAADNRRGDHEIYIAGTPAVNFAFRESSTQDLSRLVPLLLLVASFFLALTLRSLAGVLLPFFVVLLALVASVGTAGYLGFSLSAPTTALPNILIAVCIANVVHVLATFYRGLADGMSRPQAARYSLLHNFQATFLTSATTAVGFFGFSAANLKPIGALGTMAGVGTLVDWIMTYMVAGSLLFILPLRRGRVTEEQRVKGQRLVARTLAVIQRHRVAVLVVTSVVSVAGLWLSLQNEVNSDPLQYFAKDFPVRVANEFIQEHIGGTRAVEIMIDSGEEEGIKDPEFLRQVESYQRWIESQPVVTRAVSILDVLKATHRSLNADKPEFYALPGEREVISQELFMYTMGLPQGMDLNDRVSVRNDALRMTVLWTAASSKETMHYIGLLEKKAQELGLNVIVTGKNRLYNSTNDYVVNSFLGSLLSSLFLISLLLVVAFKSLKIGLFAMVPNIIPNFIGGALLYMMQQPLDIGTVLVASVSLGIAVDDTIHILANYMRERRAGRSRNDAVTDTLSHTAPALIGTTAVLAAGFGVFAIGSFIPNVYFGILMASVLSIGLVIDLTFLPAILMDRGSPEEGATSESSPLPGAMAPPPGNVPAA